MGEYKYVHGQGLAGAHDYYHDAFTFDEIRGGQCTLFGSLVMLDRVGYGGWNPGQTQTGNFLCVHLPWHDRSVLLRHLQYLQRVMSQEVQAYTLLGPPGHAYYTARARSAFAALEALVSDVAYFPMPPMEAL